MAPLSPVPGDGGVPVSVGGSLSSAVAMFSSYGPTHAVSVNSEDGLIRFARILPVGTHLSYHQLFKPADIYQDSHVFSAHKEILGIVFTIDAHRGTASIVDSYTAPVRLQLFPQERFEEGLRAPPAFWQNIASRLRANERDVYGAQTELLAMVDRYAAEIFGEEDVAAPFIVNARFVPTYVSHASVAIARDSFHRGLVPSAAARVAAVQLARLRTDQPPLERPEMTDLVARLNGQEWPRARPIMNAWQKQKAKQRKSA